MAKKMMLGKKHMVNRAAPKVQGKDLGRVKGVHKTHKKSKKM